MGVFGIVKGVGSLAAGVGACWVTESVVMSVGHATTNSKVIRVCVDLAAMACGSMAMRTVSKEFYDQCEELEDAYNKLKAHLKESREAKEAEKKEDVNVGK